MQQKYKIGEVVRLKTLEEGTITNIRDEEPSVFVTWNHSTGLNGWFKPEELFMARGSVSSASGGAMTLADINGGVIGFNSDSLEKEL